MADADASLGHNSTTPTQDAIPKVYDPSAAQAQGSASTAATNTTATATLPLRQSRSPLGNLQPKVYDVTEKFTRACSALEVGQLVKDEYFTLFESIGAIEIMDPKMDSGFLQPGETLEDDYDTLAPLLPEELIGIMDQLLCHEMAWHTGYPLSQTLFTSVYIDKLLWPEVKVLERAQFYRGNIADDKRPGPLLEVLRAYCLAVIKGCDYVIAKITSRDYFEEEDFCTHTYNRVLFVNMPMDVFLRELDAAMEVMQDNDLQIDDNLRAAILSRLEFRKFFLRALDIDLSLGQMAYSWPPTLESLQALKTSHELGKTVPGAFSSKLQRRLASTVPPRPIVELSFADATTQLENLVSDCTEATCFVDLPQDPLEYQSFLWYFASRSPPPLAYARSYLATLLFHPDVLQSSVSLPLADVKSLILPASPLLDPTNWTLSPPRNPMMPKPPRLQFALLIDEFIERAGQAYLDLWVCLGQNRCRLRRMLTHVIVGWDLLQADASLIDADIARAAASLSLSPQVMDFSLSTWVYARKLWMIERVIHMGFEQDIYLPDEYGGMYLFLSLIATRRKELLKRVEGFHNTHRTYLLSTRDFHAVQEIDEEHSPYLQALLAEAEATASLSLALAHFYTTLLYLHLLPLPHRPFSTESLRYELRMKPFLTLQPPEAPPYEEFKTHTQPYGPFTSPDPVFHTDVRDADSGLWREIDAQLKNAKEAYAEVKRLGAGAARAQGVQSAWGKGVQSALASCIALGVAVAGVKSAVAGEGKDVEREQGFGIRIEIPEAGVGKRYAEGWVVVKVVKV
ncbi:amino-acid N-acetyltransferas-like protein subunit Mak10 [Plenodomus tracheiphilus IPT5]|uniref:Amino-acid N-acetyltransferas-like protein subunit Mak10 n=1 Tax=Plenodomus tracheiphilus IPT5 TaxID=1408161 RepID=A0A6A7BIJ7_9PLEO|nr:amino-acid N-acetyltransferas-like protein subunit Mak10 [Plenodomus tracheiphilus IPT5]